MRCLAIRVTRKLKSIDVIDVLSRSVHPARRAGPHSFRQWAGVRRQGGAGVDRRGRREDRLHRAGSPWENGYVESFNARLRDELLNGEIFYSLREAQIVIESWRRHYNTVRPHASLGYQATGARGLRAGLRRVASLAGCAHSLVHAASSRRRSHQLTL